MERNTLFIYCLVGFYTNTRRTCWVMELLFIFLRCLKNSNNLTETTLITMADSSFRIELIWSLLSPSKLTPTARLLQKVTHFHKSTDCESCFEIDQFLGTTKRGIGPTYASKMNRYGLRIGDLKNWDSFLVKYKYIQDKFIE